MIGRTPRPAIERFNEKYQVNPETGCWDWQCGLDRNGYAFFNEGHGLEQGGHRFSFKHFVGAIPSHLHIDHLCRNPRCVNPDHLDLVTPAENTRRAHRAHHYLRARTHCKNGHEFTPENTGFPPRGGRRCRTCCRNRDRIYKAERKAAKVAAKGAA